LIAVVLAILAAAGGVLYNLAAYYLSRWWGVQPPLSQDLADFAIITSVALVLFIVAIQLWRGSGWARLAVQLELVGLGLSAGGYGLAQVSIDNLWGLVALGIAVIPIGTAVYLETSAVRVSFRLQPAGLIVRRPVVAVAVLATVGLVLLLLLTLAAIDQLPVNRYR
jgi:hypothetical protein